MHKTMEFDLYDHQLESSHLTNLQFVLLNNLILCNAWIENWLFALGIARI